MLQHTLGKQFKKLREKANLSQIEAARRIGTSGQYLSNIERGTCGPPPVRLKAMSVAYKTPLTKIIRLAVGVETQKITALATKGRPKARKVTKRKTKRATKKH